MVPDLKGQKDEPVCIISVIPKSEKPRWRTEWLQKLNLLLTVPMFTGYLIGFDSSMLNGIQSVPVWVEGS